MTASAMRVCTWLQGFCLFVAEMFAGSAAALSAADSPPLAFPVGELPFVAELAGIDREWNVSLKSAGKVRVVAAADLAYWGRYRDVEAGSQILLANGSAIRADVLLLDDKQLILGHATGLRRGQWDESRLPRETIRAIQWQPAADARDRDRMTHDLLGHRRPEDRTLLIGGDEAVGRIVSVPASGRFASEDRPPGGDVFQLAHPSSRGELLAIPVAKVVASNFKAIEAATASPPERTAWIGFADGSLIHVRSLSIKGDVVSLGLASGGQLQTTLSGREEGRTAFWSSVTYVEPVSQRVTWLSDLTPIGYKHIPFLSVSRTYGRNKSVVGTKLRAAESVIPRGLGMPSAARLAYEVAGFRTFDALLAIDTAAEQAGSVIFKVLLEQTPNEWTTAYTSPIVRSGDAPLAISIPLQNAARMALLTDFADRGDACDYVDWLYARLNR